MPSPIDTTLPAADSEAAAHQLVREVGAELRQIRTRRNEALEEIGAFLQIKPTLLYGLEQGDISVIGDIDGAGEVMRRYSAYLGIDGDTLASKLAPAFALLLQPAAAVPALPPRAAAEATPWLVWTGAVAAGVVVGLGVVFWGGLLGTIGSVAQEPTVAAPDGAATSAGAAAPASAAAEAAGQPATPLAEGGPSEALPDAAGEAPLPEPAGLGRLRSLRPQAGPALAEVATFGAAGEDGLAASAAAEQGTARDTAHIEDQAAEVADVLAALASGASHDANFAHIYGVGHAGARVIVHALRQSWVQISSPARDFTWTRTLKPDEAFMVPNRADLELWTGNAGGIELFLDGQPLAPIGPEGMVVRRLSLDPDDLRAALGLAAPASAASTSTGLDSAAPAAH